jgi:excisionase family DNA binding protein
MPAVAERFEVPGQEPVSGEEREALEILRRIVAASAEGGRPELADGRSREVRSVVPTPRLAALLGKILGALTRGDSVAVVPRHAMPTTQQAADLSNVSRPFLVELLERGEIPFERVGRHRRIRAGDLEVYMRRRDEERSRALDELFEADADLIRCRCRSWADLRSFSMLPFSCPP